MQRSIECSCSMTTCYSVTCLYLYTCASLYPSVRCGVPPTLCAGRGARSPGQGHRHKRPPATGHRPEHPPRGNREGARRSAEGRRGMRCSAAQPPAVRPMRRRSGLGVLPRLSRGAVVSAFVSGERGPRPHTCHCTHTARWLLVKQKRASAAPSVCCRAR